jgi:hypothetical protein
MPIFRPAISEKYPKEPAEGNGRFLLSCCARPVRLASLLRAGICPIFCPIYGTYVEDTLELAKLIRGPS